MTDAAVRGRGDEPDCVEDGAAADGDNIGMAVDPVLEQLSLHLLDEVQLDLDLLPAGTGMGSETSVMRSA